MSDLNRRAALLGSLLLAACLPAAAQGQAWPTKPVTVLVPFPPGGGTDAFARPLVQALGKATGKTFNIDNRGGAGGTLGAGIAAKMPADGHSFFMGAVHHAIAPAVYRNLAYNLESDFVPVALISSVPQVIVVNSSKLPVSTLPELLDYVRKHPGKLNYASAGNGTSHHLAGELFKQQTKTFITHIPYRGAGPALQDLVAGQIEMMFDGLGSSAQHIRAGTIRAIAVAGDKPAPGFGQVPLAKQGGAPDYLVATWYGLWAPKGTPPSAITAMQMELRKAYATDEIRATWTSLGSEIPVLIGDDFGRFVSAETQRWATVVKAARIRLD
jgi:tripartite-type tricarboxylate transporter receptor subunit TctC